MTNQVASEHDEKEVLELIQSIKDEYFPDLGVALEFLVEWDPGASGGGAAGRILFNTRPIQVILYYGDDRVIQPAYRMGLVPIVAHELAHLINPVKPDKVLAERLPPAMYQVWQQLVECGEARCSMERRRR